MYEGGEGGGPPEYPVEPRAGITSKLKYNLEGLIPLILIIIIVAFLGHKFGFWDIPFLGGEQPMQMLIIGQPSTDFTNILNQNKDLVSYYIRSADHLNINPKEQLSRYDVVVLDQHLMTKKEVSSQLGDAIQDYVRSGGKFITIMDSGIRRTGASDVLGWKATFGDIVPVSCERTGETDVPSCTNRIHLAGYIERDDYKHPIMQGIERAPAEGYAPYYLETFQVVVTESRGQVAYILNADRTGEWYPGIVEKKLVIGKSIYFGYDPGKTRGILENTLKYLKGKI
ncbi:MAG: hypothetical protein ABIE23_00635 [archaeon]